MDGKRITTTNVDGEGKWRKRRRRGNSDSEEEIPKQNREPKSCNKVTTKHAISHTA